MRALLNLAAAAALQRAMHLARALLFPLQLANVRVVLAVRLLRGGEAGLLNWRRCRGVWAQLSCQTMRARLIACMSLLAGLLAQQDSPPLDASAAGAAKRIWGARLQEQQELWFRRSVTLQKPAKAATLVFSCDNGCTVFLNGQKVGASDDWETLTIVDVTEAMLAGDNTLAVHAVNTSSSAAMAVWLYWQDETGAAGEVVSGKDWRVAEQEFVGWAENKFDDRKWPFAVEQGDAKFGKNVYNGKPREIVYRLAFHQSAEAMAKHLHALRCARNAADAERALEAMERALNEARAKVWKMREAEMRKSAGAGTPAKKVPVEKAKQ